MADYQGPKPQQNTEEIQSLKDIAEELKRLANLQKRQPREGPTAMQRSGAARGEGARRGAETGAAQSTEGISGAKNEIGDIVEKITDLIAGLARAIDKWGLGGMGAETAAAPGRIYEERKGLTYGRPMQAAEDYAAAMRRMGKPVDPGDIEELYRMTETVGAREAEARKRVRDEYSMTPQFVSDFSAALTDNALSRGREWKQTVDFYTNKLVQEP